MEPVSVRLLAEKLRSNDVSITTLVDGSGALVNIEGMEILTFNETGMRIVNHMREGKATLPDLVRAILTDFDVDEAAAVRDVEDFVCRLNAAFFGENPKG